MSEIPYFVQFKEALEISQRRKIIVGIEELDLDSCHNRILPKTSYQKLTIHHLIILLWMVSQ